MPFCTLVTVRLSSVLKIIHLLRMGSSICYQMPPFYSHFVAVHFIFQQVFAEVTWVFDRYQNRCCYAIFTVIFVSIVTRCSKTVQPHILVELGYFPVIMNGFCFDFNPKTDFTADLIAAGALFFAIIVNLQ